MLILDGVVFIVTLSKSKSDVVVTYLYIREVEQYPPPYEGVNLLKKDTAGIDHNPRREQEQLPTPSTQLRGCC